jgi:sulfatase maturation enzyme AslB (radical SAM superfamily)
MGVIDGTASRFGEIAGMNETVQSNAKRDGPIWTIYLTGRCSLSCRYCFERGDDIAPEDLTKSALLELLAQVRHTFPSPGTLVLFGGEPTLRWDLITFCKETLEERPLNTSTEIVLFTNGLHLGAGRLSALKGTGWRIALSYDGHGALSYWRYGEHSERMSARAERTLGLSVSMGINTTAVFSVGNFNVNRIPAEMQRIHEAHGVRDFKINTIRRRDFSATLHDLLEARERCREWAAFRGAHVDWRPPGVVGVDQQTVFVSSRKMSTCEPLTGLSWDVVSW